MSRIHEALKKAEQERVSNQAGIEPLVSVPLGEAVGMDSAVAVDTMPVAVGAGPTPVPAFSSSYTVDTLLARSAAVQWKPDPTTMLFFNSDDSAPGTEEFRTLRSRLYHAREKMSLRKLLISSALPREGKSFTAANLAQVMVRQHGRRVLLIDADLRGPRLHEMLGTVSSPGLSDYLSGQCDEFSIMQRGPMENLFFIPSGQRIENPAELISNGKLKFLLQRVEPLFDWIILDSPPVVPVSDAGVIANCCDGVLIVVRSESTPFDMARKARQEFGGHTVLGVVLNGKQNQSSYARYYNEGYEKKSNGREA